MPLGLKNKCVLYHLYNFFPPRIRVVSLKQIYHKYDRFTVLFFHPCLWLLYRIINLLPQWRVVRFLDTLLFRISRRFFRGARTVIVPCKKSRKK